MISLLSLGTSALVCSLSDLRSLVRVRESEFKSRNQKIQEGWILGASSSWLREIYFIMCSVHEQPGEAWSSLAAVVRAEKSSIMEHEGDK